MKNWMVGLCVVAVAASVVGLLIGYVRIGGAVMRQFATLGYSRAEGRVVQSGVKGAGDGTSVPDIHYTYVVQSREYRSHQFNYLRRSEISADNWSAQGEVEARPVGAWVVVYYNPWDPADAVLVRGIWGPDWIEVGIVFAPLLVLVEWWRKRGTAAANEAKEGNSSVAEAKEGNSTADPGPEA